MNTEKVTVGGIVVNIRLEKNRNDMQVVDEVIGRDCYGIRKKMSSIPATSDLFVLDIGGHIGTFGLLIKSLFPRARVLAFEPNEVSAELYRRNVEDNRMIDVTVYNKAVSYDPDRHVFLDSAVSTGGGWLVNETVAKQMVGTTNHQWGVDTYTVMKSEASTIKLEDIVPVDTVVDLMKIDCEGSEYDIIEKMSESLAVRIMGMVGERHGDVNRFLEICKRKFPHLVYEGERSGFFQQFSLMPLGGR